MNLWNGQKYINFRARIKQNLPKKRAKISKNLAVKKKNFLSNLMRKKKFVKNLKKSNSLFNFARFRPVFFQIFSCGNSLETTLRDIKRNRSLKIALKFRQELGLRNKLNSYRSCQYSNSYGQVRITHLEIFLTFIPLYLCEPWYGTS